MSRTRASACLLAIAAVVACCLSVLTPAASAQTVRFGSWTPGDPYHGATPGNDALEAATGRRVDIVNWYQSWGGGDWIASVQRLAIGAVTGANRTPMITWEPWQPGRGPDQPAYRLSRIAAGDYDLYLTAWAVGLKLVGATVYLRPMHEMNGDWYPWGGTVNANTPEDYVRAWRHVVDLFRRLGANNVRWVWSPVNVDVPIGNAMERYYPGEGYVDVLAVDGYNWGSGRPEFGGWQSFGTVFGVAYDRLRALGPQPIWIAEVGTSPNGGDKAAWIRDMFARAAGMTRLEAIVWFNEDKEEDWRAAPTPEIAAAFRPDGADGGGSGSGDGSGGAARRGTTARRPKLTLVVRRRVRAGAHATVRWHASRATKVVRWHAYLNGRRVRSATRSAPRIARSRVQRPGRYRWTVVGRDSRGRKVVSGTRAFRVSRS